MRRLALRTLIGSIALSALTGIYLLLVGSGGDFEGKVLVTALSVSGVSILAMACGAALERGRLGWLPHAGTVTAVAAFVLLMVVIWDVDGHRTLVQWALTLILAAAAAALACLLSLADLAPRFRWVGALGYFSDAALATMLDLFVWDLLDTHDELFSRLTGVFSILLAAVTVAVPILHRMSSLGGATGSVRHCVACGREVTGAPGGEVVCSGCGARFRVEFSAEGRR